MFGVCSHYKVFAHVTIMFEALRILQYNADSFSYISAIICSYDPRILKKNMEINSQRKQSVKNCLLCPTSWSTYICAFHIKM